MRIAQSLLITVNFKVYFLYNVFWKNSTNKVFDIFLSNLLEYYSHKSQR